jgi:hypothetical protein
MKNYEACVDTIMKAGGEKLTEEEIMDLLENLQARERYYKAKGLADQSQAALQAADDLANQIKLAAVIEKRNAALNLVKRVERVAWIQKNFGNNLAEGLEAMLVGVNRARQGSREGVSQVQHALRNQYRAGFITDLERTGHLNLFSSGTMDRDVARALWAMSRDDQAQVHAKLPKEAVELANVVHKWQEVSRLDANMAGAWVGKVDGYITRQSHDPEKIRGSGTDADFQKWQEDAINYFDIPQMIINNGVVDPQKMLTGLWNDLASGNHMRAVPNGEVSGFKGPGNLAKKVSQGRTILFRDADAWFDYNQKYGTGNLRESVENGLAHSADSTGMMQVLGTNPQAMFETIKSDLITQAKEAGNVNLISNLQKKEGRLANMMAAVDGSMNIPGNAMWARRAANLRSWEMMAKLGGMILSQLNDVAIYGSGAKYQGRGFFSGMAEAVSGLGRNLKPQETRELASSLGVMLDNMAGELGRVGTFSEAGSWAKATQIFMKLNLSDWWTKRMRTSAAFGMSHHMALQSGKAWDAIGSEYQRVLTLYNITPEKWDVIRKTSAKHVDGKDYIVPEGVRTLSDDQIKTYLTATKQTASEDSVSRARIEIENNLRNYYVDQTSVLALEPDAKTRAILLQGSKPGTWTGEMFRFMMQFKSFTAAYMQRIAGRELLGRGYEGDSLIGALKNGNGEFTGLAQLIVTSTLLGYGSLALKDLAKGKTPRDPTESPEMGLKVLLASLVQGGGAGIYGDFLFGAANRAGSGTVESLAGPTISSAGRIIDLYHKAMEGDKFAARAVNEALSNTPFMNLFYGRMALDYMVFHRMQEWLNPGYLARKEADAQKNNNQTFFIKPTEYFGT